MSTEHLAATARLLMAGLMRRGGGGLAPEVVPARKVAAERKGIAVDRTRVARYLAATRGREMQGTEEFLPPTFTSTWETALALELLAGDSLPFPSRGIVHLGGDLIAIRPISLHDSHLRMRLELERMEAHRRGCALLLRTRLWNDAGHLCQENRTRVLLVGAQVPAGVGRRGREEEVRGLPGDGWREVASWEVGPGAGRAYARASGDYNPVHLWPWSARLMGFERPILHGHCSIAMVANEMERLAGSVPRRLTANFKAPLQLPARVRLEVAPVAGEDGRAVRLVPGEGEGRPFLEGFWVGGASPGGQG